MFITLIKALLTATAILNAPASPQTNVDTLALAPNLYSAVDLSAASGFFGADSNFFGNDQIYPHYPGDISLSLGSNNFYSQNKADSVIFGSTNVPKYFPWTSTNGPNYSVDSYSSRVVPPPSPHGDSFFITGSSTDFPRYNAFLSSSVPFEIEEIEEESTSEQLVGPACNLPSNDVEGSAPDVSQIVSRTSAGRANANAGILRRVRVEERGSVPVTGGTRFLKIIGEE